MSSARDLNVGADGLSRAASDRGQDDAKGNPASHNRQTRCEPDTQDQQTLIPSVVSALLFARNPHHNFAPIDSTTASPTPKRATRAAPIRIPPRTLTARDLNRCLTPLSGRGDRKGHLVLSPRSPSPRHWRISKPYHHKLRTFSDSSTCSDGTARLARSGSLPRTSDRAFCTLYNSAMTMSSGSSLYPGSPLSPRSPGQRPTSPLPSASRRVGNHGRQPNRSQPLGRYHPLNFAQADAALVNAAGTAITLTRAPPPTIVAETPRAMKKQQREFLERVKLGQKLAASPMSEKPSRPAIEPLGDPNGPVTPLTLEEQDEYFLAATSSLARVSPKQNSGTKSPRSNSLSSDDDTKPLSKARKLDVV